MFGNSINIFDVKPNKITCNINQYPMVIGGMTGDGKTYSLNKILTEMATDGRKPLFLMLEDRHYHIAGINAIRIRSISDLENVKNQLLTPKAKEMFSCIVIDTVDRLDELICDYVAKSKNVAIAQDIAFGKSNAYIKAQTMFLTEIKNYGFPIHFIMQYDKTVNFATGKQEFVPKCNKEILKSIMCDAYLVGMIYVDPIKKDRYLTFKKSETYPALKDSIGLPDKVLVDDFNDVLREAIIKMGGEDITTEDTIINQKIDTRDFNKIKEEIKQLGGKLFEAGLNKETTVVMNNVLGVDDQGNPKSFESVNENQIDMLDLLLIKMKELANKKGIK